MNVAKALGIAANDPRYPVVQLERWTTPEFVTGISRGNDVPNIGAVVLRIMMPELGRESGPELLVRAKIFKHGTSDWTGIILGARALDCMARGGLGFRPTAGCHYFERLGIGVARAEVVGREDAYKDIAYRMGVYSPGMDPRPYGAAREGILDEVLKPEEPAGIVAKNNKIREAKSV